MFHPEDYAAIEKLFRGAAIPEDLATEYEICRKMVTAWGHSGSLGMYLIIPLMRRLGYGKIVEQVPVEVDWRTHLGDEVIVQYGDQRVGGKLLDLCHHHRLGIQLEGYGYVEMPRYCVQLVPSKELEIAKTAWEQVKKGAKVTVTTEAGPVPGKFVESTGDGLRVNIRGGNAIYPVEAVELAS